METKKKPLKWGEELLSEIRETNVMDGVSVWWIGQSGYVIKHKETVLYIDPYLSEHLTIKYQGTGNPHVRMTEAPFRGEQIDRVDLIVSSHKHSDHMDPETIPKMMDRNRNAIYLIPAVHLGHVSGWGIDMTRVFGVTVDQEVKIGDISIIPQPAKHEVFDYSDSYGYPYMSFIIRAGDITLYHSGDTVPYDGMIERLKENCVDIAMLPINGRDARRHTNGTPGNCTMEESLCIAALSSVPCLVPHHYEMFTFNTVDIGSFQELAGELYPELRYCVFQCAERALFKKRKGKLLWNK